MVHFSALLHYVKMSIWKQSMQTTKMVIYSSIYRKTKKIRHAALKLIQMNEEKTVAQLCATVFLAISRRDLAISRRDLAISRRDLANLTVYSSLGLRNKF